MTHLSINRFNSRRIVLSRIRSIVFSLICALACFTLVSCGGSDSSPVQTIRFWHFWSEPNQRNVLREMVAQFERDNNCKVELTELNWNDGQTKLRNAFSWGNPPDVIELGSDWVAQYSSAGVLDRVKPVDSLFGRFVEHSFVPAMWKNSAYALPWTLDTRVIYLNKKMLRDAGWQKDITTMDDLLAACRMVQAKGMYGFAANGEDKHRLYKKFLPFMWSYGGDLFEPNTIKPILNSPQNVQALTMYVELARTGFIETQRELDKDFLQGKVAVWNSGSWMLKKFASVKDLEVEAILFPGTAAHPGVSFTGGEYLAVSSKSTHKDLAHDLVAFLTHGANSSQFCARIGEAGFPADVKYYNDPKLMTNPLKQVFARQLLHARLTPVHPKWLDVEAILETAVSKVLLGQAAPQEALDVAQQEVLDLNVSVNTSN